MEKKQILHSNEKAELSFIKGTASAFISEVISYGQVPDKLSIKDALFLEGAFIASLKFARGGGTSLFIRP